MSECPFQVPGNYNEYKLLFLEMSVVCNLFLLKTVLCSNISLRNEQLKKCFTGSRSSFFCQMWLDPIYFNPIIITVYYTYY
jgi:hypothetical protein